ncbi:MAG: RagB/SusD family nutrient uptake outer membrane protein, partial [Dysgonamonadaceae bacterium]|nr:RagB/SusD family nutrient uptake outer membrane protein [Dysgonamonadaceae bacterium]
MKKIAGCLALSTIVIITFTQCNDFLEVKSESTFNTKVIFSDLDLATKTVLGLYANLALSDFYEYVVGFFYSCDSDIEHTYGNDDSGGRAIARYKANGGNSYLSGPWRLMYQTIERANICIDNLPNSPLWTGDESKEAKRLYGEALTIRALCYFELVRNWGDVPFPAKSFQDGDPYVLPKTNRDLIYERMIADLLVAEEYVPWMKETKTVERVSKGFVKGLRARMALAYAGFSYRNAGEIAGRGRYWEEYYGIARTECKEIMDSREHRLYPNYRDFFKKLHAYQMDLEYGESLFEIAFGRSYSGQVGYTLGMSFLTSPSHPTYGWAMASFATNPYYFFSFHTNDTVRRSVSCELYNYSNKDYPGRQNLIGINGWRLCKWRKNWIQPNMGGNLRDVKYTGINWPLMRYADIVLMYAEAENQLGSTPSQEAKDALASVRKRAFAPATWPATVEHYIDSVSVDKQTFFQAVVNERAWEFGGEMIRKYDLIRWNLLGEKLNLVKTESRKIADYNTNTNNYPEWRHVPGYLYYRYLSDGETLEILNPDRNLGYTTVSGYSRTTWISTKSDKSTLYKLLDDIGNGYDPAKNNHLLPISATIIDE